VVAVKPKCSPTSKNFRVRNATRIVIEYGKGFSQPGVDKFRVDRAANIADYAHLANFPHPVIYFYSHRKPTSGEILGFDDKVS